MKIRPTTLAALFSTLVFSVPAMAGPDWTEEGDAGSFAGDAQVPTGNGQIRSLTGRLGVRGGGTDFEDMYLIGVDDPSEFSLTILNTDFDAVLYMFHFTQAGAALGLLANDNQNEESILPRLVGVATDGTGVTLDLAGDYLIAVCGAGRRPVSATGAIFNFETSTEVSGADGPGGLNRHIGWEGEGATGDYRIDMTGTVFPRIPAPGSLAVIGAAGLIARRRR